MLGQEYGISVDNIFVVQPKACPSFEEIKKLPNKMLLWCGKTLVLSVSNCFWIKFFISSNSVSSSIFCRLKKLKHVEASA